MMHQSLRKNIFLTGAPSSGKTTVIKKLIARLECPAQGFYTEEERIDGRRTGFMMTSLQGGRGYLAHQDIRSDIHVRRYGVSLENIERIAVNAILPGAGTVIILDEIGKMECFSEAFRQMALRALDADNIVVGTITLGGDDFIKSVKSRNDMEIIEMTLANRDALPEVIVNKVRELQKQRQG